MIPHAAVKTRPAHFRLKSSPSFVYLSAISGYSCACCSMYSMVACSHEIAPSRVLDTSSYPSGASTSSSSSGSAIAAPSAAPSSYSPLRCRTPVATTIECVRAHDPRQNGLETQNSLPVLRNALPQSPTQSHSLMFLCNKLLPQRRASDGAAEGAQGEVGRKYGSSNRDVSRSSRELCFFVFTRAVVFPRVGRAAQTCTLRAREQRHPRCDASLWLL